MHKFLYNQLRLMDPNGGAGGVPPQQQQQNNQGGGDNGAGQKKEEPTGLARFANLWDPPKPKDQPAGGGNNGGGNNGQQGNPAPGAKMAEHLAKFNYADGVDQNAMKAAWENRDFDGFMKTLSGMFTNLHKYALTEANTLAEHYSKQEGTNAVKQASNNFAVNQVYEQMFAKHEFLKSPAIAPMARQVVARNMQSGMDVDKAIQHTYDYFVEVGKASQPNSNQSGHGSSNGGSSEGTASLDVDALFGGATG